MLLLAQVAAPLPPTDWSELPELPISPPAGFDPSTYVRDEVGAGRCRAERGEVVSPVAVLIDGRGTVQRIVPRAIGCPTVEQFTAGYVSSLARRVDGLRPGWHRYTVTYRWQG